MKIAVKVILFQLYEDVLSKFQKSVKWVFKWHSNSKPSTLIHGHKVKKKKKETYDWSPFQDLSNGVLHHL